MVQQCRANSLPLVLVDDGESHLGLLRLNDDVTSATDNHWSSTFLYHYDQGHVSDKVDVHEEGNFPLLKVAPHGKETAVEGLGTGTANGGDLVGPVVRSEGTD